MRARRVSARLVLDVRSTCDLSLLVAAARTPGWQVDDELVVHLDGSELPEGARPVEVPVGPAGRGERMHVLTGVPQGELVVEYSGTVAPGDGADPAPAADPEQAARDRFELNRPSRYCPSDELAAFAAAEFGSRRERSDADLAAAVERWVADRLVYTSGSSTSFDGAVQTMLRGQGVCRDYAHLVVALCRALELPARLTAVYAPGLSPMDFHAVAEVRVVRDDGAADWEVLDATRLAPRRALSRISTGRDAADTAFLTSLRGGLVLQQMTVTAVLDGDLPAEDGGRTVLA
ncbi:transglutaminase family protein [Quadrisphaera sp. INWT6]|uniref:transglutaminase-like domain-containing protein n=1 Tax=Quadrisphaera sp. INWT6 TaxID=2596917 RepID=UPI0018925966|nr:transglutaminase family protein [Quadrisphaera sp. INWT6]